MNAHCSAIVQAFQTDPTHGFRKSTDRHDSASCGSVKLAIPQFMKLASRASDGQITTDDTAILIRRLVPELVQAILLTPSVGSRQECGRSLRISGVLRN